MSSKPVVVVGDGWAALGAVGFLASSGLEVTWIGSAGARPLAPLACLERGPGIPILMELATKLEVNLGELRSGSFIREFRNKAFREPAWTKAPTPEARLEVKNEVLWAPERRMVGAFDSRFTQPFSEIEEEFRKKLMSEHFPNLREVRENPITGFKKNDDQIVSVILGSGDEIECSQVIYADRWSLLPTFEGLPRPLNFLRNRDPMGVLQASFVHRHPVITGVPESFFAALPRESGEKIERHVWGYFSSDGKRSTWTLCLTPEEVEDNHEIAKKFRRLKSTLDRIFSGSGLLPADQGSLTSTILEEQVRFNEEFIFAEGKLDPLVQEVKNTTGILFLTDAYGPSRSFEQVGAALGIEPLNFDAQTESMNFVGPGAPEPLS